MTRACVQQVSKDNQVSRGRLIEDSSQSGQIFREHIRNRNARMPEGLFLSQMQVRDPQCCPYGAPDGMFGKEVQINTTESNWQTTIHSLKSPS